MVGVVWASASAIGYRLSAIGADIAISSSSSSSSSSATGACLEGKGPFDERDLRQRHLSMVAVSIVGDMHHLDGHAIHQRGPLETILRPSPQAGGRADVAILVKPGQVNLVVGWTNAESGRDKSV